jgi:hypothetical protein
LPAFLRSHRAPPLLAVASVVGVVASGLVSIAAAARERPSETAKAFLWPAGTALALLFAFAIAMLGARYLTDGGWLIRSRGRGLSFRTSLVLVALVGIGLGLVAGGRAKYDPVTVGPGLQCPYRVMDAGEPYCVGADLYDAIDASEQQAGAATMLLGFTALLAIAATQMRRDQSAGG